MTVWVWGFMSEIFCIALSRWHVQMREDKERDDEQIKERHTHGEREREREREREGEHTLLSQTHDTKVEAGRVGNKEKRGLGTL